MSDEDRAHLSWHTIWTLIGILIGFMTIAVQVSMQYDSFRTNIEIYRYAVNDRLSRLEVKIDDLDKHVVNIQYQLDHERATH